MDCFDCLSIPLNSFGIMVNESTVCFPEFDPPPGIYFRRVIAFVEECPTPAISGEGGYWKFGENLPKINT